MITVIQYTDVQPSDFFEKPNCRCRLLVKCKQGKTSGDTAIRSNLKLYFSLRLNLPGEIVEDGRESASYDVDKGKEMIDW